MYNRERADSLFGCIFRNFLVLVIPGAVLSLDLAEVGSFSAGCINFSGVVVRHADIVHSELVNRYRVHSGVVLKYCSDKCLRESESGKPEYIGLFFIKPFGEK